MESLARAAIAAAKETAPSRPAGLCMLMAASSVPPSSHVASTPHTPHELLREAFYGINSGSHAAGTPPLDAARGGRRAGAEDGDGFGCCNRWAC